MEIKEVVSVSLDGQSQPSKKNCILGCLKPNTISKNKVMTIAAILPGAELVSLDEEKSLLTVIGEGIDGVDLVNELRKKVKFAILVNHDPEPVEKKEEKPAENKEEKPAENKEETVINNNRVIPMIQMWEVRDPYYNNSCYPWW